MAEFVKVATVQEIKPAQGKLVQAGGKEIALFNVNGELFAIADSCAHAGGPLSEGTLAEYTITCPWHGSKYDVRTGKVLGGPAIQGMASYKIKFEGGDIFIEVD